MLALNQPSQDSTDVHDKIADDVVSAIGDILNSKTIDHFCFYYQKANKAELDWELIVQNLTQFPYKTVRSIIKENSTLNYFMAEMNKSFTHWNAFNGLNVSNKLKTIEHFSQKVH